jgi:cell division transport system permease protein
MITSFFRIIKYGIQNFTRNGWLSVAASAIMVMTLIVFVGLAMFDAISKAAINSVQDKIDISVYFKSGVSEEIIFDFQGELSASAEVKSVEYISQEKALELFKERHESDETISQALEELNGNPLLASLTIKANDPNDYAKIDFQVGEIEKTFIGSESIQLDGEKDDPVSVELVDKVTFTQNQLVIERLTKIIDTFQNIGLGTTLLLSIIAILITFNTIRLAIYSNRQEVGIMRLVGATNAFINGPYLVTGILYGIVAAVVSILIVIPIVRVATPHVMALIPEMNLQVHFEKNILSFFLVQLLAGALLGALSSAIAIRKYLKL